MRRILYSGFTLMEILIVVSIIAIMATIATVSWQSITIKGKISAAYEEMRLLSTAETWAHNDTGIFWPFKDLALPNLPPRDIYANFLGSGLTLPQLGITIDSSMWHGPYLSTQVVEKKLFYGEKVYDSWGNEHPITDWQILPSFSKGDPVDSWGNPYRLVLLKNDTTSSYTVNTAGIFATAPSDLPATAMVISNGPNGRPEYVIEAIDQAQQIYRFRQLSLSDITTQSSPYYRAEPAKRSVDDLIILF